MQKFTLTLTLSRSPYPSGSKSSLDACPPFLPGRGKKGCKPGKPAIWILF